MGFKIVWPTRNFRWKWHRTHLTHSRNSVKAEMYLSHFGEKEHIIYFIFNSVLKKRSAFHIRNLRRYWFVRLCEKNISGNIRVRSFVFTVYWYTCNFQCNRSNFRSSVLKGQFHEIWRFFNGYKKEEHRFKIHRLYLDDDPQDPGGDMAGMHARLVIW